MVRITGNGPCDASGGTSSGFGDGNYGVGVFDNGNGDGHGDTGYDHGDGSGGGTRVLLYCMHPYACLTFWGAPDDDTFDDFTFHLQVEPLVHRRMG